MPPVELYDAVDDVHAAVRIGEHPRHLAEVRRLLSQDTVFHPALVRELAGLAAARRRLQHAVRKLDRLAAATDDLAPTASETAAALRRTAAALIRPALALTVWAKLAHDGMPDASRRLLLAFFDYRQLVEQLQDLVEQLSFALPPGR